MLNEMDKNILKSIKEFIKKEEIPPTVREIGKLVGLKSTSSVHGHLNKLEELGYISRKKESPRSLRILKTCS